MRRPLVGQGDGCSNFDNLRIEVTMPLVKQSQRGRASSPRPYMYAEVLVAPTAKLRAIMPILARRGILESPNYTFCANFAMAGEHADDFGYALVAVIL